jgi:hypothetical protein
MKWNHPLLWYRSDFNTDIKCDYITNNITEVFNNWVKDHKDLPVCELADKIRVKVMELFFSRGEGLERNLRERYFPLIKRSVGP